MKKTIDVTALGELLIDYTSYGESDAGGKLYEQNAGGAPANVLVALERLGSKTAFIGKVGEDLQGEFLRETLRALGVELSGLISDPDYFTTLAFVGLKNGERTFSFARKPGADTMLRKEEIPPDLLGNCRIFHFGSLSLTDEPARSATLFAAEEAKKAGALISYDPNYRAALWPDEQTAVAMMRKPLPLVDLLKISDEECELLAGISDPKEAAEALLEQGISAVFVTLGENGALMCTREMCVTVPAADFSAFGQDFFTGGYAEKPVDTTGAGDSFWGAVLYCFASENLKPSEIGEEKGREILRFANTVAGLCVRKRGAIPAMPSYEEAVRILNALPAVR